MAKQIKIKLYQIVLLYMIIKLSNSFFFPYLIIYIDKHLHFPNFYYNLSFFLFNVLRFFFFKFGLANLDVIYDVFVHIRL